MTVIHNRPATKGFKHPRQAEFAELADDKVNMVDVLEPQHLHGWHEWIVFSEFPPDINPCKDPLARLARGAHMCGRGAMGYLRYCDNELRCMMCGTRPPDNVDAMIKILEL